MDIFKTRNLKTIPLGRPLSFKVPYTLSNPCFDPISILISDKGTTHIPFRNVDRVIHSVPLHDVEPAVVNILIEEIMDPEVNAGDEVLHRMNVAFYQNEHSIYVREATQAPGIKRTFTDLLTAKNLIDLMDKPDVSKMRSAFVHSPRLVSYLWHMTEDDGERFYTPSRSLMQPASISTEPAHSIEDWPANIVSYGDHRSSFVRVENNTIEVQAIRDYTSIEFIARRRVGFTCINPSKHDQLVIKEFPAR